VILLKKWLAVKRASGGLIVKKKRNPEGLR
jgi:hypothetical protein